MSIATRINAIEEHIANAYSRLDDLGIDITEVDKNIDNIANVLEEYYDDQPKVTATDVTAAGPATAVTVATGALDADGTGATVATGLGTPTKATVLKGVKVTAQPTITLAADSSGFKTGETITFGTGSLNVTGTAAAQTWSGKTSTGTTGQPSA